jgi:hypothetical protein
MPLVRPPVQGIAATRMSQDLFVYSAAKASRHQTLLMIAMGNRRLLVF